MSFLRRFVCLFSSNADAGATVPIIPGQEDSSRRRQLSDRDKGGVGDKGMQPVVGKSRSLDTTGDPQLRERRKKEKKAAKRVENSSSTHLSIISLSWMSQWSAFLRGGVLPGPIDLSELKDRKGKLKKRAMMGVDYVLVAKELADYLASVYGGDQPIPTDTHLNPIIPNPDPDTPRTVPPVMPPTVRPKPMEAKVSPWSDEPPLEITQGEVTPEASGSVLDLSSVTIDRSTTVTSHSTIIPGKPPKSSGSPDCDSSSSSKAEKGLVGLDNSGLYCYLNASLQCLLSLHRFRDWAIRETDPKRKFCFAMGEITRKLFENGDMTVTSAGEMIDIVCRKFPGNKMHDSVEFLGYLLEHMDREMVKRHRTKSVGDGWTMFQATHSQFLIETFAGVLKSDVNCASCGHYSSTLDPFLQLDLPLAKSVSHALEDFIQREPLSPAYVCPGCTRVQACSRKITLQRCPNALILTLKRFQSRPHPEKLNQFVTFHKKLEVGKYTEGGATSYQLQSVLVHSGDTEAGHYVAYCKRGHSWYMFNDNLIQSVKLKEVLMQQAYVLLYALETQA